MHPEVPIQVAVRVRPLLGEEIHKNPDPCLYCVPNKPQIIIGKDRHFSFDYVLSQESSQTDVYNSCVRSLIPSFFEGYNATVFAYGQTGSGKTYTMGTGNCVYLDEEERGVIPRAVTDIFDQITALEGKVICKLRVSFIEVYREETTDLLENSTKNLQIREDEAGNVVIVGVREEPADNMEEVLNILDAGTAIRHVGSTNMNDVSSRSHCLFTIILDQYQLMETDTSKISGNLLTSLFHFVDLAGSERAHRTGNQGERFKESVSINTGLLALGNVISALSDPKRKTQHIPYRESKLTRLLKDSLGGNSRTVMITCLSSALADLDENINSLKYATRANIIRNKPRVNWDMESSKVSRMEGEIQALRGQLQRKMTDQTQQVDKVQTQKINDLEIINEKHESEHNHFLQNLHEVNVLLQAIESSVPLPSHLIMDILKWRHMWGRSQFDRPVTAPSKRSALRRPQNDVIENLRSEVMRLKGELCRMESSCQDIEEVKLEVIAFGQENAQLRLELDIAMNNQSEMKDKLFEQQLRIQNMRLSAAHSREIYDKETPAQNIPSLLSPQDRVLQNFRVKSDMLLSQLEDMDSVERDEDISSDEDDGGGDEPARITKQISEPSMTRGRRFASLIPRPSKIAHNALSGRVTHNGLGEHGKKSQLPLLDLSDVEQETLVRLQTSRDTARHEVKTAEINVREVGNRLKELEHNIQQKEGLIGELVRSEKEARATSGTYRDKLNRLEKEFEKSKRELEEAQQKVNQYEKGSSKDAVQKSKLENDYKKKLKTMQKKFDDFKQKETVSNRISSYQQNNEKKVKDLEAWISRMKNQQAELERKLKSEGDKKSKYEQELHKNELRIKELEHKTDQQQKLLKRKNEEVVAAQRKLRNSTGAEMAKANDHLEKKKQWIDNEIEKVIARQRDIDVLETELRERDQSLKTKEALISEKDQLEVKKTKSSQHLSKSIMQLSVQMETVDEQINELQRKDKFGKDLQRLENIKEELTAQKEHLEETVQSGGLESQERRRLIELGEAIEAVDEAIQFKNVLISEKQSYLDEDNIDNYRNVEHLLNDMGELAVDEYKHLLGKLFLKIIELRKATHEADETRFHFEMKVSEQEKNILELQHVLQVVESRNEKHTVEQNSKYERDIQFLMEQLRTMENDVSSRDNAVNATLERKVSTLEKELYYYKVKSRKYKDHLKDFTNNVSIDTAADAQHEVSAGHNKRNIDNGEEFHLPPVKNSASREKRFQMEQPAIDEHRRIQEIFESKPPSSPSNGKSSKRAKDGNNKKKHAEEQTFADSIEPAVKHPWHT